MRKGKGEAQGHEDMKHLCTGKCAHSTLLCGKYIVAMKKGRGFGTLLIL